MTSDLFVSSRSSPGASPGTAGRCGITGLKRSKLATGTSLVGRPVRPRSRQVARAAPVMTLVCSRVARRIGPFATSLRRSVARSGSERRLRCRCRRARAPAEFPAPRQGRTVRRPGSPVWRPVVVRARPPRVGGHRGLALNGISQDVNINSTPSRLGSLLPASIAPTVTTGGAEPAAGIAPQSGHLRSRPPYPPRPSNGVRNATPFAERRDSLAGPSVVTLAGVRACRRGRTACAATPLNDFGPGRDHLGHADHPGAPGAQFAAEGQFASKAPIPSTQATAPSPRFAIRTATDGCCRRSRLGRPVASNMPTLRSRPSLTLPTRCAVLRPRTVTTRSIRAASTT